MGGHDCYMADIAMLTPETAMESTGTTCANSYDTPGHLLVMLVRINAFASPPSIAYLSFLRPGIEDGSAFDPVEPVARPLREAIRRPFSRLRE